MSHRILSNLENLQQRIQTEGIPKEAASTREWGGADVIIKREMDDMTRQWLGHRSEVISLQATTPRRRAVITEHAIELSWLFEQLKVIFAGQIDYISKYDFYGLLAQSALDYIESRPADRDATGLLLAVIATARGFVEEPAH